MHFQLIFLLIGQNDLCKLACIHNGTLHQFDNGNIQFQRSEEFAQNIKRGLDKLMRGLPKSLVALILPPGKVLNP